MTFFIIIGCTLVFCAWLAYERQKNTRLSRKASQEFWEREDEANHTRNRDISSLEFFQVDPSTIPNNTYDSQPIIGVRQQVLSAIERPMVDFSAYSNTDLKLMYGIGNFTTITSYDNNYNNMLTLLSELARAYQDEDHYVEAETCYLLAFQYGSQKVSDYTALAKVYLSNDQPDKLAKLITQVQESHLPRKDSLLQYLRKAMASYQ